VKQEDPVWEFLQQISFPLYLAWERHSTPFS